MQGQFERKKEHAPEPIEKKKEIARRPHASAMSEGPMLVAGSQEIEKRAREQNAKSVKTELEAILSRFKRKKRHTTLKIKGKKLADDPLPPDDPAGQEGGGEGDDGEGGAKKGGADG